MNLSNAKDWEETVTLPPGISHYQFGISAKEFKLHIKDKKLKVQHITGRFIYVDVNGELFGIHQDDLLPGAK